MAKFTGANLYLEFKGVAFNANYREFKMNVEMGLVDASAGADAAKTYLKTLLDGGGSYKGLYQGGTATSDEFLLLTAGANGTLIVAPKGTASGNPKWTISDAIVKKSEPGLKYDDVSELDVEFQFNAVAGASYSTYS